MAYKVVDARGLACPEPVVLTQQAAREYDIFQILVDNEVAVQNITRFCTNKKLQLEVQEEEGQWRLSIQKK